MATGSFNREIPSSDLAGKDIMESLDLKQPSLAPNHLTQYTSIGPDFELSFAAQGASEELIRIIGIYTC